MLYLATAWFAGSQGKSEALDLGAILVDLEHQTRAIDSVTYFPTAALAAWLSTQSRLAGLTVVLGNARRARPFAPELMALRLFLQTYMERKLNGHCLEVLLPPAGLALLARSAAAVGVTTTMLSDDNTRPSVIASYLAPLTAGLLADLGATAAVCLVDLALARSQAGLTHLLPGATELAASVTLGASSMLVEGAARGAVLVGTAAVMARAFGAIDTLARDHGNSKQQDDASTAPNLPGDRPDGHQ